ncbi:LLM class flavin-dependent oxidoreductase [Alkalicoccus luteus]|uniref:LLM class flavin-dependent oxidoreductase n=1 Tax=Alkalicoccus luteus TaxID=1237094 RepID=UPI004033AE2D
MHALPVSALNLAPVRQGETIADAIDAMTRLAASVEDAGYTRYWIAEHHNTPTLVSSATPLLIQRTLEETSSIRVGSGGMMLPNHSPLVVAEQFGTLAELYPERVDLGLGRAPGTDMNTARALRRTHMDTAVHSFPDDVQDLLHYFGPPEIQGKVKAHPGVGTGVPLYILGSSTDSAVLAARLGLPYAFAAHFAPQQMEAAIRIYREQFQPSEWLDKPHMIVCLNVIAMESDEEAAREQTTMQQFFLNVVRGTQQPLQPPVASMDGIWSPQEKAMSQAMSSMTLAGSEETVSRQLQEFQSRFAADEIMVVSYIYDEEKQHASYRRFADIAKKTSSSQTTT